jgi:hypothetical protein
MSCYQYTEDGIRLYTCPTCLDQGWVHPRFEDGKPDYSKIVRCDCEAEIERQQGKLFQDK